MRVYVAIRANLARVTQEAFHRIKESTGVSDVNEVMGKETKRKIHIILGNSICMTLMNGLFNIVNMCTAQQPKICYEHVVANPLAIKHMLRIVIGFVISGMTNIVII